MPLENNGLSTITLFKASKKVPAQGTLAADVDKAGCANLRRLIGTSTCTRSDADEADVNLLIPRNSTGKPELKKSKIESRISKRAVDETEEDGSTCTVNLGNANDSISTEFNKDSTASE